MKTILKKITAVFIGLILAVLTIFVVEYFSPKVSLNIFFQNPKVELLIKVAIAHWIGVWVGGWVAVSISKNKMQAFTIGLVIMIFSLLNLMMIPHPFWFWAVDLLPQFPLAVLGGKLALAISKK